MMSGVVQALLSMILLLSTSTGLTAEPAQPVPADGRPLSVQQWTRYDWNAASDKKGAARFEIVQSKDGVLLKISAATPNDARLVQELTVEAATYYRFTCQVRSENVGKDARGAGISVADVQDGSPDIKASVKEWQSLEFYGKTGPDQHKLTVTVGIGGYGSLNSGTAWFRNITVNKLIVVPTGIRIAELQLPTDTATVSTVGRRSGGTAIAALACIGLFLLWWGNCIRRRSGNAVEMAQNSPVQAAVLQKWIEWRDVAVMAALSAVCLMISLFNLGGQVAPETGWQAVEAGESVTFELGRQVDLSRIYYYCGFSDNNGEGNRYSIDVRNSTGNFVKMPSFSRDDVGSWKFSELDVRTSTVRLTAESPGGRVNEIALVEKGSRSPLTGLMVADENSTGTGRKNAQNLIDEQFSFEYAPSFRTGFYFDEIYHARAAWEMLNRIEPYESTHPPLGKLLISSGIALFGMNPFGWRVMGAMFGVALVPLMYLFGLKLFRSRFYAFCAAFLMMVEFMRFAQSRVAVIDVYGVFFILLMYYYILDLFPARGELPRRSPNLTLLLAGVAFGIGAACKWIALYAGCGMVLLVILKTVADLRHGDFPAAYGPAGFLLRRIGVCLVTFGLIPALIYLAAYIPYLALTGPGHGLSDVFRLQAHMLNYHRSLQATHAFSSPWWSWPLDLHPMWMYTGEGLPAGFASSIVSFGNPAIFWLGIPAVAASACLALRRRDAGMGVVLTALLCQYLPWVGINRLAFIYHFFSTVPFMILCIVATLRSMELGFPSFRTITWGYLGIAAALYILFYPVLSGLQVPQSYIAALKWLPTWFF